MAVILSRPQCVMFQGHNMYSVAHKPSRKECYYKYLSYNETGPWKNTFKFVVNTLSAVGLALLTARTGTTVTKFGGSRMHIRDWYKMA